jgi:hypothetical protein
MNILEPYVTFLKIMALIAIAAGIFGAGAYVSRDHYLSIISTNAANYAKAYSVSVNEALAKAEAHQIDVTKAETQHAKDQLSINALTLQLGGMRIHIPVCGSAAGQGSAPGQSSDGASGVLSSSMDDSFARLQAGAGKLFQRCDQINIDAIQLNESLNRP